MPVPKSPYAIKIKPKSISKKTPALKKTGVKKVVKKKKCSYCS